MRVKVKGFKFFKDRYGKQRCYHRATGIAVDLEKFDIGTVEFLTECTRITGLNAVTAAKPGSLGLLIVEWKKSPAWKDLKPKTHRFYNEALDYLKPIYDTPLVKFNAPLVVRIRDKAQAKKSWYFANQVKTTLSTVFSWGAERGHCDNPAKAVRKVKRPKNLLRANRPWTADECHIVLEDCEAHFRPLIGFVRYTGADVCDAITLPKTKWNGHAFDFNRQKTGNPVYKPAPAALKAILKEMPEHDAITLFANSYGKPWSRSGVDSVWQRQKKRLEDEGKISPGLTLKGLRHTFATNIRELGENDRTIADAIGDKTETMGHHYSRDADIKDNMNRVTKAFDKKHKIVKLTKKSVKLKRGA